MDTTKVKAKRHERRKIRVRKHVLGSTERPRLSVFRSLTHIYAQIIDDVTGKTLVAASSVEAKAVGGNKVAATAIGKRLAEKAKAAGISKVCFDRNGVKYHGRVKALADGAREGGLQF
jgi:large subunit ribosomal protein L18